MQPILKFVHSLLKKRAKVVLKSASSGHSDDCWIEDSLVLAVLGYQHIVFIRLLEVILLSLLNSVCSDGFPKLLLLLSATRQKRMKSSELVGSVFVKMGGTGTCEELVLYTSLHPMK